jgi:dTDP-4-dehydrorhamnose 3,5-epimerase-like enzyme
VLGNLDDLTIRQYLGRRDDRGELFVVEIDALVPFVVRRVFFIHDVPAGSSRGHHGHYRCRQLLICQNGRLHIDATDGERTKAFDLDAGQGILVDPGIYLSFTHLEPDSILLALVDSHYDPTDYIRDLETLRRFRTSSK